jgi:hypothetical protein
MDHSSQKTLTEIRDRVAALQAGQDALAEITVNLQAQVAVSVDLVRRLVQLLTPNETPDGQPRLEDLLSRMIAQQSAIIEITTKTASLVAAIHSGLAETDAAAPHPASGTRC